MLAEDEGVKPSVAGKKLEKAEQPTYPEEPEMVDTQFVRVNVRHITDGKGTIRVPLPSASIVPILSALTDFICLQVQTQQQRQTIVFNKLIASFIH